MSDRAPVLIPRRRWAVLNAEARTLANLCQRYGVLTSHQLQELSHAHRWTRGRFSRALEVATELGLIRDVGLGFYAPPHPQGSELGSADRMEPSDAALTDEDFQHLLELRSGLRRFLRWSEDQATAAGLTATQHQLLLAVRGHPDPAGPTIGDIADYLVLRHHSAVGLVDRAAKDDLVTRTPDPASKSVVRVKLTPKGTAKLEALAEAHVQELAHLAPTMRNLWRALERVEDSKAHQPRARRSGRAAATRKSSAA